MRNTVHRSLKASASLSLTSFPFSISSDSSLSKLFITYLIFSLSLSSKKSSVKSNLGVYMAIQVKKRATNAYSSALLKLSLSKTYSLKVWITTKNTSGSNSDRNISSNCEKAISRKYIYLYHGSFIFLTKNFSKISDVSGALSSSVSLMFKIYRTISSS